MKDALPTSPGDVSEIKPTVVSPLPAARERNHTYGQILKSSALIGGSSVINVAIGIVRTKAMAVLLGPAGFGLMGIYNSVADVAQSIAGMGIQSSGVRQIAESVASGESDRIARTVVVLRRTAVVLGVLGALLLIVFSRQVSTLTFGNPTHAAAISLLSIAVLFRSVSTAQGALLQGMRRIADLAKIGIFGAVFSVVVAIPLVYFLRENGIVPSLICMAAMTIGVSWWYSRKIQIEAPSLTIMEVWNEASALLKLGLAFMASALLTMGAAYANRLIVLRQAGFEAAGLYQAAWVVGGLYVGFILQAMGSDFYPRLTGVAKDSAECNRIVNEQAHVSLLLAGPGVIGTLTLAPLVIVAFYSAKFSGAVEALRWVCLGMVLRIVAWPMGFIILARNLQKIFFWTEVAATVVHVGLAWLLTLRFGVAGATMAFFGLYVWHGILIYIIVRRLTGFRWSPENRRLGILFLPIVGFVFCAFYFLPFGVATAVGILATLLTGIYSLRRLLNLVSLERIPGPVLRLLARLGLTPGPLHK